MKIIVIIIIVALFLLFKSYIIENFNNADKFTWTDIATTQCNALTEEAKVIDTYMDSCNNTNPTGQRQRLNDKWACVDNVNREINNTREKNLWCKAKDNQSYISELSMNITGNPISGNPHDLKSAFDFAPFEAGIADTDFYSLDKENKSVINSNADLVESILSPISTVSTSTPIISSSSSSSIASTNDLTNITNSDVLSSTISLKEHFDFDNVNSIIRASGDIEKYRLLNAPFLDGNDESEKHLFASI